LKIQFCVSSFLVFWLKYLGWLSLVVLIYTAFLLTLIVLGNSELVTLKFLSQGKHCMAVSTFLVSESFLRETLDNEDHEVQRFGGL